MDNQQFYWILAKTHLVVFGVTVLVGLFRFKKLDVTGRLFLGFLFLMFSISLTSFVWASSGTNNFFLSFGESFSVMMLIGFWFPRLFSERPKKWIAYFLAAITFIAILAEMYIFQKTMSESSAFFGSLSIVICASLGIHSLMSDDQISELSSVPYFWILVGLLVTNAFSSLFNGFRANIMATSVDLFMQFVIIELLLQICTFLLYTYIFLKRY
jgi:hypothetical protein